MHHNRQQLINKLHVLQQQTLTTDSPLVKKFTATHVVSYIEIQIMALDQKESSEMLPEKPCRPCPPPPPLLVPYYTVHMTHGVGLCVIRALPSPSTSVSHLASCNSLKVDTARGFSASLSVMDATGCGERIGTRCRSATIEPSFGLTGSSARDNLPLFSAAVLIFH